MDNLQGRVLFGGNVGKDCLIVMQNEEGDAIGINLEGEELELRFFQFYEEDGVTKCYEIFNPGKIKEMCARLAGTIKDNELFSAEQIKEMLARSDK